jgi:hypothetical protein
MQLTAKLRGDFLTQIKARAAKWKSVPSTVAARIVVPPELSWWYFQEVGVPHGYMIHGTAARQGEIAFPSSGGQVVAPFVNHPGLKARHMVGSVMPEVRMDAHATLAEYMANGGADNPAGLQLAIMESAGRAKKLIAGSFEQQLPSPPRPEPDPTYAATQSGKLGGAKAAEVFSALAQVIDTSI